MLPGVPSRDARTKSQQACDRNAVVGRVYRAARLLMAGLEQLDRGVYRLNPGDVLALRTALDRAAVAVRDDERRSA